MLYNPPTGGAANDPYVGKNVAAGIQGSKVPPAAVEFTQREIVAVIAASGQAPTNTDTQQMLRGVRSGVLEHYIDNGALNAPAIAPAPAHTSLVDGLHVRVHMKYAPTGAATLAINTLGAPIQRVGGAALVGGEWAADDVVDLIYNAKRNAFQIAGLTKNDIAVPTPPAPIAYGATQNLFLAKDGANNFGLSFGNGPADARPQLADADRIILFDSVDQVEVTDTLARLASYFLSKIISTNTFRQKLSGNLNLYVRSDGSDLNNGLANTAAGAFKTLQGCWNAIFGLYDPAGYTITINFAQGAGNGGTFGPINFYGYTGPVILAGDPSSPTQAIVSCGGQHVAPVIANGPQLQIQNCVLQYDYAGTQSAIEATLDAVANTVTLAGIVTFRCGFARSNLYEIFAQGSGTQIIFADNATIVGDGTGSRNVFIQTVSGASMTVGQSAGNIVFQSTSTIAYNTFAIATKNSSQDWTAGSYAGFSATGVQARASYVSAVVLGGKTLPGNAAPVSSPSTYGVVA